MAVRLSRKAPLHTPLPLPGGIVWRLRRASSIDAEQARAAVTRMLAGVADGSRQMETLHQVFGGLFDIDAPLDGDRLAALSTFLADVQLAVICSDGWEGVLDDGGRIVVEPDIGSVALLLADTGLREKVQERLYATILDIEQEKKDSGGSPVGAAAAASTPAPTAGPAASPVRKD